MWGDSFLRQDLLRSLRPTLNPQCSPTLSYQVLAGFQTRSVLWSATVQSTARRVASPHLRLLLATLCLCTEAEQEPRETLM